MYKCTQAKCTLLSSVSFLSYHSCKIVVARRLTQLCMCAWMPQVDMYVFLTEQGNVPDGQFNMADLVWSETGIRLAEPESRSATINYELTPVSFIQEFPFF